MSDNLKKKVDELCYLVIGLSVVNDIKSKEKKVKFCVGCNFKKQLNIGKCMKAGKI